MINKAKQEARRILRDNSNDIPIDVHAVARAHNIDVRKIALEDEVSGVLIIKNGRAIIGVNDSHSEKRQRFTIAHELGHYILHRTSTDVFVEDVFVDAAPVFFRDAQSADGTVTQEVEANAFAAELLMPEDILRTELRNQPIDAFDDVALRQLAARFLVSVQALTIRLTRLGLITLE